MYENFYAHKKFYVHEITPVNLSKIYFLKNAKKTCRPNNCDLNRDCKKIETKGTLETGDQYHYLTLIQKLYQKLKKNFPTVIPSNQNIEGYLVTMDIEKAFDFFDHDFLVTVLSKFGFGSSFISWIKLLLNSQKSCAINGGNTTPYLNLEKGARQGDQVSAYLFILALDTLLMQMSLPVKELINSFNQFYHFSGLKANIEKCEIAGIGYLKGVTDAVCGLKCVDLSNDTIKILGIHFS